MQEVLNRWLTGNYATVLDVEPLAGDPLYPAAVEESKEEPVAANGIVDESAVAAAGKSTLVVPHPSSASAANASGNVPSYFTRLVHGMLAPSSPWCCV